MREIQLSLADWFSWPRDLSRGLFAGGTGRQRILGNPGKFELVNRNIGAAQGTQGREEEKHIYNRIFIALVSDLRSH